MNGSMYNQPDRELEIQEMTWQEALLPYNSIWTIPLTCLEKAGYQLPVINQI